MQQELRSKKKKGSKRLGVTLHPASGQYRKGVGKYISKDGSVKDKIWYLGSDLNQAKIKAMQLKVKWLEIKQSGGRVWDEATLNPSKANAAVGKPVSVAEGVKLYLETLKQRNDAGQVTKSHYESQVYRLQRAVSPLSKMPLDLVRGPQLTNAVLQLAKRPEVGKLNGETRKMSVVYAEATIKSLKWFFEWADESEYWQKPKDFSTSFQDGPVSTTEEKAARINEGGVAEPEHFTVDDLRKLFAGASERQKLWICLGLNCGFSNAELATLQRNEIRNLDDHNPYIERHRTKTDVYAKWWLFPETVRLLRQHLATHEGNGLVFQTEEGKSLTDANAIGQSWTRLLNRTELQDVLTFKYLRKTGAWLVRQCAGTDVAEMYLAHQDRGMIRHYAGREWDRLAEALKEVRKQLLPAFHSSEEELQRLEQDLVVANWGRVLAVGSDHPDYARIVWDMENYVPKTAEGVVLAG